LMGLSRDGEAAYLLQLYGAWPSAGQPFGRLFRVTGADLVGQVHATEVDDLGVLHRDPDGQDDFAWGQPRTRSSERLFELSDGTIALLVADGFARLDPLGDGKVTRLVGPDQLTTAAPVPA